MSTRSTANKVSPAPGLKLDGEAVAAELTRRAGAMLRGLPFSSGIAKMSVSLLVPKAPELKLKTAMPVQMISVSVAVPPDALARGILNYFRIGDAL
jgi:hypothetical protein